MNSRTFLAVVGGSCCLLLAACMGRVPQPPQQANTNPSASNTDQNIAVTAPAQDSTVTPAASVQASDAPHTSDVDLTHLELGDGKVSNSPQVGYVFSCMTQFNSQGGAHLPWRAVPGSASGNWINGDGTWDATKKAVVDGSITWPSSFTMTVQGDQRIFTGNDLPDHPTGVFPIARSDEAYKYDHNPNSIKTQSISLTLPANPTAAAQPNCVGGEVGIMLSGVVLFNAFDAEGHDAPAHEVQDQCGGHPQQNGFYHYHNLSNCIQDASSGHSALLGYAFDGYGIYGMYGEDGKELTNADPDECHGHTHMIEWNGQMVMMYHYHATHEFPYVVGCFHGTPAVRALSAPGQGGGTTNGGQGQTQQPDGNGSNTGGPPAEAFTACNGLEQGASCTVNTPNGSISGICQTPPGQSQLVCVLQGGVPHP